MTATSKKHTDSHQPRQKQAKTLQTMLKTSHQDNNMLKHTQHTDNRSPRQQQVRIYPDLLTAIHQDNNR